MRGKVPFALLLLLLAGSAQAQNAIRQTGPVSAGDVATFASDHAAASGNSRLTQTGRGLNPITITDDNGPGVCNNNAATTGTYKAFCMGHDSNGNPIFSVDGVNYDFSPSATGNITGPNSSIVSDLFLANNTNGTLAKTSGFAKIDANANDGSGGTINGNAVFSLTPRLGTVSAIDHQDVIFVQPTTASYAGMTNPSDFLATFNMKWGDTGAPVPAGTKGQLVGIECNETSAQGANDSTYNDSHCFGGTIALTGGVSGWSGMAIVGTIDTLASTYRGVNINVHNNIAPDGIHAQYGYWANSDGSQTATTAFAVAPYPSNKYVSGADLSGTPLVGASSLNFATSHTVATDYQIDGAATDTLRITGGGSGGGVQFYGAPRNSGNFGQVSFNNNLVSGTQVAFVDLTSGYIHTKTFLEMQAMVAPGAPAAGNFRIYMDTADNKLKAIGPSATVTILALP